GAGSIAEVVFTALMGEGRDHHFCAGHLTHRTLHAQPVQAARREWTESNSGNKKGPSKALVCAPPRLAGSSATPGGALRYEDQQNERTHASASCLSLILIAGGYKHCVSLGQANCGNNLARAGAGSFKPAFEIVTTRKNDNR